MALKFLNSKKLSELDKKSLKNFRSVFDNSGFNSNTLLKIFGKEVTRHINISSRELYYLRSQLLYNKTNLLYLADLFLLSKKVKKNNVTKIFGKELYRSLKKIGFISETLPNVNGNVFLTPIENKLFLNDGNKFNDKKYHVIQIVMEQPYLIKAIKSFSGDILENKNGCILDLCTGSGVIGQSILPKNWSLLGVDINTRALDYSEFNLKMNNLKGKYKIMDVLNGSLKKKYDIIVANPPYNANVPIRKSRTDITLHSGIHGDNVPNACANIVKKNLNKNGMFFMCGILLLKNKNPASASLLELSKKGTLIILHKGISSISSWEGMRLLYNCTPDFNKIPKGQFDKISETNKSFNKVTWAIVIYKNNGKAGISHVYNYATDSILISQHAKKKCLSLLKK